MLEITILAMGNKMPEWIHQGVETYAARLKEAYKFKLIELPLLKRNHPHAVKQAIEKEAQKLQSAIPKSAYVVALDIEGRTFSSEALAKHIDGLQQKTSHICFIIGGPEGLTKEVLNLCQARWSLSSLTLPHPLARIVLMETLYRAWSISKNHPYHK